MVFKFQDEFCSNESYEIASSEELVEQILVTADCQADWSDKVVTKLLDEKLNSIGIKMKSIKVNRNIRKCFESCLVNIKPMQRKLIDQESFPLRRWTMKTLGGAVFLLASKFFLLPKIKYFP